MGRVSQLPGEGLRAETTETEDAEGHRCGIGSVLWVVSRDGGHRLAARLGTVVRALQSLESIRIAATSVLVTAHALLLLMFWDLLPPPLASVRVN